jgi:SAM-dependent methyltransferase
MNAPEDRTPSTADPEPIYRFAFSWEGPYGRAVHLAEDHGASGLVLDLGCGYGAVGEVLVERGRAYVGADLDPLAVADLRRRQLEAHVLDLTALDGLGDRLAGIVAGRPVGAVLLLDALEHLVDPMGVLREVSRLWEASAADGLDPPVLVTSIPNVAHFDLGAKLIGGHWDVTPSGLLDRTHVQMFTAARIQSELSARGWRECGRDDFVMAHSDQSLFPLDHPLLVEGGPARDYLWNLRSEADPHGNVNQFVRAYRFDGASALGMTDVDQDEPSEPFLSVLMVTGGEHPAHLAEALACLAGQTTDSLEVIVLVQADAGDVVASVRALAAIGPDEFVARVRVEPVGGTGRAAALNVGLALARGRYLACVDDGALVTADWAETFEHAVARDPGKVVRSLCGAGGTGQSDSQATGGHPVTSPEPIPELAAPFDLLSHLGRNTTPSMTVAFPRSLTTELHLSFDEGLTAGQDWDFLVRAALVVGVVDSGKVTAIVRRWGDGSTVPTEQQRAAHEQFLRALDARPLLLPPGSASAITGLMAAEERARRAEAARDEVLNSEFWRATAPLRLLSARLRSLLQARNGPPGR